jgi:ectoine hydroxylase-related dioxygenase (phytanoyl-CoA dioxygenase family)
MSFDYNSIDYDKLTEQFKENGYVVIENLYTKEYCDDLITQTVEAFEKINPDLNHKNKYTWKKNNLPPQTRTGMFQSLVCHLTPVKRVRNDEKYKKIFREIYSRIKTNYSVQDDLVSSIDGINIKPNNIGPYNTKTAKDWAHIDQTKRDETFKCIQGQVVLSNTTASFKCSPKSHKVYKDVLELSGKDEKDSSNWCKVPNNKYDKCKELVESIGGQWQIPIYAPAGSCILWFSTTIHSAKHSDKEESKIENDPWYGWRAVYYITYRPKNEFTQHQLKKRFLNAMNNRVMNHWTTKTFPVKTGLGFYPTENYSPHIQKYINDPKKIFELDV